jgi:hypothetical protein
VENGKEETKRVRSRDLTNSPAEEEEEDARDSQAFADSGRTGQGAQSALEHLVERERTRADRPET